MMVARDQWGREKERGIYWDIMDTGDEEGRVRRARVEECSCRSYPCVTLKSNTYLLSCKMAVRSATPDGDSGAAYTDLIQPVSHLADTVLSSKSNSSYKF